MKENYYDQLVRPRRDIFVFTMTREFFYVQYLIETFRDGDFQYTPAIIGLDEELTRVLFSALARTVIDDDCQKKQISKYCLEAMPMNGEGLFETALKMDVDWEFFTTAEMYYSIKGEETFQDENYIIHEVYAYEEEERTVDIHAALVSIALCIFEPFQKEGVIMHNLNNETVRTRFYRITGKAFEDALAIIFGTLHNKTEAKAEDYDNPQSLRNRIESVCPDTLTSQFTLYIIDKVFRIVICDSKQKDITYFHSSS